MPRGNFQTDIAGQHEVKMISGAPTQVVVLDAKRASETVIGTSRRKPSDRFIPPTPYTFDRVRYERASGSSEQVKYGANGVSVFGTQYVKGTCIDSSNVGLNSLNILNEGYSLPVAPPVSFRDRALVKARLAMKDTDVNLGVAFAERNATARMLGDTATNLAKAYRALRRGETRKAMDALGISSRKRQPRGNNAPSKWLELQYGWKPLLSDVYGAADALAKRDAYDWMVTGKGSYSEVIEVNKLVGSGHSRARCIVEGKMGCFVRIDAVPQNEVLQSFVSLGLTNPALIAWELVPFSFVVDWALPIGNWLDSLDAMLGYGPTWCSISTLTKAKWSFEGVDHRNFGAYSASYTNRFTGRKEEVHLRRTTSQSVPLPTLPRFKDPRSLGHMANGLSLLASAFAKR